MLYNFVVCPEEFCVMIALTIERHFFNEAYGNWMVFGKFHHWNNVINVFSIQFPYASLKKCLSMVRAIITQNSSGHT
ncbi:MAG: hypothetical protein ACKOEV_16355, partial [Cytophagales bacterium]